MPEGYIGKLRRKIGSAKIIHPAMRIIIENEQGEVLFVERTDNGRIGLPAGALEENETLEECVSREVLEETGIKVLELVVIGISTRPDIESVTYPNGDEVQYFTVEFYGSRWQGKPAVADREEVKRARFLARSSMADLPENERSAFESLDYFKKHGWPMLK